MPKKSFIEAIEVKSPCSENWGEMTGNEKVRFCSHCAKSVNNISEMTLKDARRLVRRSNGGLCVRYELHPITRLPIFSPGLGRIARQSGLAAGVLTASIALGGGAYAQNEAAPAEVSQTQQTESPAGGASSKITGYVTDPNGAVIPFAVVSLTNLTTNEYRAINASGEGLYEFAELTHGEYKIKFEAGGFEMKEVANISLDEASQIRRDAQLAIQQVGEVVQVRGAGELDVTVSGGIGISSYSLEDRNELVMAVMNEDIDEVKALITKGAKINVRDKAVEGMSPLHAAVETGNFEIMQLLLAYGAKPNIRDLKKRTPLMMIDEDAEPEMVRVLLAYGANIKLVDSEKNTALHHYVEFDDPDIVRLLISHGGDPNAKNKAGRTPLMIAAENGSSAAVKALIENGADVQAVTKKRQTAWDLADGDEVRSILEGYGLVGGIR